LDRSRASKSLNLARDERRCRRKAGTGNYLEVRYADDWVGLCTGTRAAALAMQEELRNVLHRMGFKLSADKTTGTHSTDGFTVLGSRIDRHRGTAG
jgi:hypothetical protein